LNVLLVSLVVLVGLLLVLEVGLRLLLGFGNPLLYLADEEIGYLLAPLQRTRRFGNRIAINEYSMRCPTLTRTRPASTLRVLLLGDSVANGAWWTDQARTISALITTQLEFVLGESSSETEILQMPFERVEVLNASANSWGPRNELAYLKRFGTFEAQAVVLLLNTDDLFAAAPTSESVGRDRNYPNRKPACALAEVFNRYLSPKLPQIGIKAVALAAQETAASKDDPLDSNLEAICQIQILAAGTGAEFLLAMTPLWREIGEPGPRDYELKARDCLTQLTQDQPISYLDFLPIFNRFETPQKLYRDHIHLSPQGNQVVSEAIARSLQHLLHLPPTTTKG
jgi:hypothetical protein